MSERRARRWLLGVLALGLALRLVSILTIKDPQRVPRTAAESDAPTYYELADNLLAGHGYRYSEHAPPTAKRTPGYPLFIASLFRLFGRDFNAVRGAQCALDTATIYLVFVLTLVVLESPLAAVLAGLAYAVYPPAVSSTTYVLTESLYTFLLVLAVASSAVALKTKNIMLYPASGIAFGLATLTRPGALLLPLALLAAGLFVRRQAWKGLVLMLLAFTVTMLPWALRNNRDMDRLIITSTLTGPNLYKGNHLPTQGAFFQSTDSLLTDDLRIRLRGASEVERDAVLRSEAVKSMLRHKQETALLLLKKIPRLWLNIGYGRRPSKKSMALATGHVAILGLALYGFLRIQSYLRYLSVVPATTVVFSSIVYLAVAAEVRFVFPLVPLVLPYTCLGLAELKARFATRP